MTHVSDIYSFLCMLAPVELQMNFDNAGFLLGHAEREVKKVILSLDITDEVIKEAISERAELIISHHPLIWNAPKKITEDDFTARKILSLVENGIAAICMHTNLDIAEGGVNDVLIDLLGADAIAALDEENCGRIGFMREEQCIDEFIQHCKLVLNANGVRYIKSTNTVKKLAVMGGAGADAIAEAARLGCDTYVTSDVKYHEFQLAEELGLNLIDADHFCTENPIIPVLKDKLSGKFQDVDFLISKVHKQLVQFA